MNKKELTPLEALYKVKDLLFCEMDEENYEKETNIIETALKRLEKIDKQDSVIGIIEEEPLDVVSKKLKALEIIKKNGWIALDVGYENYDEWKKHHIAFIDIKTGEFPLTQAEFDLLKEVLL